MLTYGNIIVICWASFLIIWGFLAFRVKRDIRGGYSRLWHKSWLLRIIIAAFFIFVAIRIATGHAHYTNSAKIFSYSIFTPPLAIGWIGAIFAVVGLAFAIWGRLHLGSNWSPRPAVKEHHELVSSGPYAYVRHPIYSGVILMTLGAALSGSPFGVYVFIICSFLLAFRIGKEEKIMLGLFPNEYPQYQSRTKRLIPFIW